MTQPGAEVTDRHPRKCTARRSDGEPCERWAIAGGTVCPSHGGSTRHVKAAAVRRLAQVRIRRRLDEMDVTPVDDPLEEFAGVVAEMIALKDLLAGHVADLEDLAGPDHLGDERIDVRYAALERALDRVGRFLAEWVRLGLDERRVVLREQQAELVAAAMKVLLRGLFDMLRAEPVTPGRLVELERKAAPELARSALLEVVARES